MGNARYDFNFRKIRYVYFISFLRTCYIKGKIAVKSVAQLKLILTLAPRHAIMTEVEKGVV